MLSDQDKRSTKQQHVHGARRKDTAAMPAAVPIRLVSVLREVVDDIIDRSRLSAGIDACQDRKADFANDTEMMLAGIAMVPEARDLVNQRLTKYWDRFSGGGAGNSSVIADRRNREVIIGGGLYAAVYAAIRVQMGFPKPIVLEQYGADRVGGAFAMSLNPVFRLNSRNRPGSVGLPDQDKALNYLPGGLIQPSMVTSEEYPDNAAMAWIIRLTLAQYADVYPDITVEQLIPVIDGDGYLMDIDTNRGLIRPGRVIDARGTGDERNADLADGQLIFTFSQFMARMGGMFPLRGMQQIAVIGGPNRDGNGGDAGKCAVESALGMSPGNTSAIGLDYVTRVDWYTELANGRTCESFRRSQRGRYIRIGQYLEGNESNPSTRLRVMGSRAGMPALLPNGVLVEDRTYDLAVLCTGSARKSLEDDLNYFNVPASVNARTSTGGSSVAKTANPYPSYRIGVAADIDFTGTEFDASIGNNPSNKVAMFRLAPRVAAFATRLPGL